MLVCILYRFLNACLEFRIYLRKLKLDCDLSTDIEKKNLKSRFEKLKNCPEGVTRQIITCNDCERKMQNYGYTKKVPNANLRSKF